MGRGAGKRRAGSEQASSLFPFLSVLACLIGTLTLLIAALAIGQIAEGLQQREIDPGEQARLAEERAELRALEGRLETAEQLAEELAAAAAELRALGVQPQQGESERRRAIQARESAAQLANVLRRLEQESATLDGSILGVEADLVSEHSNDDQRPIRILPHGAGQPLRPFFVECRKEGVRVYHQNLRESFYLARENIDDVAQFRTFLQRVRSVRDGTVIFLIRPDGVDTWAWASGQSGHLYVRHAKLPLPSHGELEFAL
jgi:hypothetical protein